MLNRKFSILSPLVVIAATSIAQGQTIDPGDRPRAVAGSELQKYQSVEAGERLVQKLSLRQKLRGRLDEIAAELGDELAASDRATLLHYATLETEHSNYVRQRLQQAQKDVCERRSGRDAVALEEAFSRGIRAVANESEQYYRTILHTLSKQGQQTVLAHVDAQIASGAIAEARFDTVAFAKERPDLAMQAVEAACNAPAAPPKPASQVSAGDAAFGTLTR